MLLYGGKEKKMQKTVNTYSFIHSFRQDDYTTTERGDVGSMVRIAAVEALWVPTAYVPWT